MRLSPGLCVALAVAALAVPPWLAPLPPLLDYPNHFARLWLIAGGVEREPLAPIYAIDWAGTSTNLGPDLIAAALGPLVGMDQLGPALVAAALALPPFGAVLLNRAVFGGWHWWQVGFAVLAWNSTLIGGFLTFQIGLGLALVAAALDPRLGGRRTAVAANFIRMVTCGTLVVWHVFAAAFYLALVAGLAFGAEWPARRDPAALRRRLGRAAGATAAASALPAGLFLLLAPRLPGQHAPAGVYDLDLRMAVAVKATTLVSSFATYSLPLDLAAILALYAVARIAMRRSGLLLHAGLLIAAAGMLLIGLLMPPGLGGNSATDWRLTLMALLTGIAALRPAPERRHVPLLALALLAVALLRTTWITAIWHGRQVDADVVARLLDMVPAGAAILPAKLTADADAAEPLGRNSAVGLATWLHLPALAVPRRAAFVPTLFTSPGKQPLRVLPPWNEISAFEGGPVPLAMLTRFDATPFWSYMAGFAENWRTRFDYVLLLNADLPPASGQPIPPELELLADEGFARLYRLPRPAP